MLCPHALGLPRPSAASYNRDMNRSRRLNRSASTRILCAATLAAACTTQTQVSPAAPPTESLERADGRRVQGRIAGSLAAGFSFIPADGSPALALEPGSIVRFDAPAREPVVGAPLFRVLCGEVSRVSGSLRSISAVDVRLGVSWQAPEIALPRPGVQVVLQRPGVARVLVDNFESLEPALETNRQDRAGR